MSLAAKSGVETHVIDQWIHTGKPVLTSLRRHTTLGLAMGKPSTKIVGDAYGRKMPKVEFERMKKLTVGQRYYAFPFADVVDAGANYARGTGTTSLSAPSTDPFEAARFQTSWYGINYLISDDKMDELKGQNYVIGGTFETNIGDAIMRGYLNDTASDIWATGSSKMPTDGVLGSIRAQISDGMDATARGVASSTDETNYASWLGFTRDASLTKYSSYYWYQSGSPALTHAMLLLAADQCYKNGATDLVAPMNSARFRALEAVVRDAYGQNCLRSEMLSDLGIPAGQTLMIGDIHCYIDTDIAAGTWQVLIDLPSMLFGSTFNQVNLKSFDVSGVRGAQNLKGSIYHQLIITNPAACALLTGLESK